MKKSDLGKKDEIPEWHEPRGVWGVGGCSDFISMASQFYINPCINSGNKEQLEKILNKASDTSVTLSMGIAVIGQTLQEEDVSIPSAYHFGKLLEELGGILFNMSNIQYDLANALGKKGGMK